MLAYPVGAIIIVGLPTLRSAALRRFWRRPRRVTVKVRVVRLKGTRPGP
jgi:hypothetical protein